MKQQEKLRKDKQSEEQKGDRGDKRTIMSFILSRGVTEADHQSE